MVDAPRGARRYVFADGPRGGLSLELITLIGEDGEPVCETCAVSKSVVARVRGLIGHAPLREGEGMLISPCWSVHTAFLHFPIDVVFLDRDLRVLQVVRELRPWHTAACPRAVSVLEFAAGEAARHKVAVGDRLAWGVASAPPA